MSKQLWCQEVETDHQVVDGFYSPVSVKCMKPVAKGSDRCAEHQVKRIWPSLDEFVKAGLAWLDI